MKIFRSSGITVAIALLSLGGTDAGAAINIVPQPNTLTLGAGTLTLGATDVVPVYRDAGSDSTLPWVEKLFKQAKIPTSRVQGSGDAKVVINMTPDATLGAEGYKLSITATQIIITAPTLTGQFYATQSLRQLFPATIEDSNSTVPLPVALPQLEISDKPRFEYRGSMVDPVRHFIPLPYLYQHVDRMALYKLNRLHFLISNDQGYRLESKVFPRLHLKGAVTQVGGGRPPAGERWYYTQDEMRAFIAYAANRKIKVIPEIDAPGHCGAILAAMDSINPPATAGSSLKTRPMGKLETGPDPFGAGPQFTDGIRTDEGVKVSMFNMISGDPARAKALDFLGKLWSEMATIFPSDQYQMGGDEAQFDQTSPQFENFSRDVQQILKSLGKKTIAWDEVKGAGALLDGNWSQDWNITTNNGDVASNCNRFYFDHRQEKQDPANSLTWCGEGYVSIENTYSGLLANSLKGVEGILFGERIFTTADADRQLYPRLTAVAEIGWVTSNNNFPGYLSRLGAHGARFSKMGIKYYKTTHANLTWQTADLNPQSTNLYSGFIPVLVSTAIKNGKLVNQRAATNPSGVGFNPLGRKVRFSESGHPESVHYFKKP